jgi:hydroxymethylbilane synthase
VEKMLAAINHMPTAHALACERAFLAALDGSCRTPIAGLATIDGDRLAFNGVILSPDGKQSHNVSSDGLAANAAEIGRAAGEKLRRNAGAHFFDGWN